MAKKKENTTNTIKDTTSTPMETPETIETKPIKQSNNKKTSNKPPKENTNKTNTKQPSKENNIDTKQNIDTSKEENHSVADPSPVPKRKPTGQKGLRTRAIEYETKLQIVQDYEDGIPTQDIADKYGIARSYIYRILNEPAMKEVRETKRQAATKSLHDVMQAQAATIESITTKYLNLANDDSRIAKTSLGGLFTVFGIIIDKQLKLEELRLKREELEIRREEAKKASKNDTGLLSDFLEVIKEAKK